MDRKSYVVEKILNKRIKNDKAEYFLKWKGYNNTHNKWISEDMLECYELLKKFELENRKTPKRRLNSISSKNSKKAKVQIKKPFQKQSDKCAANGLFDRSIQFEDSDDDGSANYNTDDCVDFQCNVAKGLFLII